MLKIYTGYNFTIVILIEWCMMQNMPYLLKSMLLKNVICKYKLKVAVSGLIPSLTLQRSFNFSVTVTTTIHAHLT